VPRVGVLTPAASDQSPIFAAFRQGLRELGYAEGRDIVLEFRCASGDYGALARLAADLVRLPVDVLVTDGGAAVEIAAAAAAGTAVPIVMGTSSADPVALGLAASLARPGGRVTGFTLQASELNAKRVDLLRAAFPDATALTVLLNPANAGSDLYFRVTREAARSLGLTVARLDIGSAEALRAVSPQAIDPAGVLLVVPDAMLWNHRRGIVALAAAARVPALYPEREYAEEGGLIAYGANVPDNFRRAASYVDRILKGAAPGELPIQVPVKFDFVVNLKTARALGIAIPPEILARADEVIE
jgi:putative ABC transport system substrate-binding protein